MKDTDLKPLAIELVLTNPQDGYAGAIDLCAEITIEEKGFFGDVYKTGANAGKPKETKRQRRIRAIIDFKSGRKGFFPEHEVQLLAYKTMWNMHFEKYPVEKVFNWSPKDWRGTTPTYNFKDQTESKNAQKLPYLVELARIEDEKRDNTIVACAGIIDLDKPDFENNITELSLAEVVKKRKQKPEEKPEAGISPEEVASAMEALGINNKTANEPDLRPSESEKSENGTNVPKEKEKPVKPKKTAKDKQKENISALLNGDDEL